MLPRYLQKGGISKSFSYETYKENINGHNSGYYNETLTENGQTIYNINNKYGGKKKKTKRKKYKSNNQLLLENDINWRNHLKKSRRKSRKKSKQKSKKKTKKTSVKPEFIEGKWEGDNWVANRSDMKWATSKNICKCNFKLKFNSDDPSPGGLGMCSQCTPENIIIKGNNTKLWKNKNKKWIQIN